MTGDLFGLFGESHDSAGKRKVRQLLKLRAEMLDPAKLFKAAMEIVDHKDPPEDESYEAMIGRRSRENFAELLRAWRVARGGISMAEAARRLNVPYRTLQDWQLALHAPRGYARLAIEARLRRPPRRKS